MRSSILMFAVALLLVGCGAEPSYLKEKDIKTRISQYVHKTFPVADIPGMSIAFIQQDQSYFLNLGYADKEDKDSVTSETLFQIGSCSKAFTALALARIIDEGKIGLSDPITKFLPWLTFTFEGKKETVTIGHLLHHSSGIPWNTISNIPESNEENALEQTVRTLVDRELDEKPGKEYQYATINYDVLALVIEKVTGKSFERVLYDDVFNWLGLERTSVGEALDSTHLSQGYKIGFFQPRIFQAPVYRGNNAAGYIISNAVDMTKWLHLQMGKSDAEAYRLATITHARDETVPPHDMSFYAAGWHSSLKGDGAIFHGGLNPNFTSFIGFRKSEQIGVVVLANSNSSYTGIIGNNILHLLADEEIDSDLVPFDNNDGVYSAASFIAGLYIIVAMVYLFILLRAVSRRTRTFQSPTVSQIGGFALISLGAIPVAYGIYLLPKSVYDFSWQAALVWSPLSFVFSTVLISAAIAVTFLIHTIGFLFPEPDKFKKYLPSIILLSILSGISNLILILLVTSAIGSSVELKYLTFYYALTLVLYLYGRRFVQFNLIILTREIVYDLRMKVLDRIFSTSSQNFENMDRGRVYTVLNDDVNTLGESTTMAVTLVINVFTALGAFVYLGAIAFWATLITIGLILSLTTLYYLVTTSTNKYFEEARDSRNTFMGLIDDMTEGFKELSLKKKRKTEYYFDVSESANEYRVKSSKANIRFVNASLIGECVLILILGTVAFGLREFFPAIQDYVLTNFIIVLLYLIGPVNGILGAVPAVMRIRIAWVRIQQFLADMPVSSDFKASVPAPAAHCIKSLCLKDLQFQYYSNEKGNFSVGPINLELSQGEIVFIVGGNGSGKSTLAKLLTGLYQPHHGNIYVNGREVSGQELGEYYSAVFSPLHLFKKLYGVDASATAHTAQPYLKLLDLEAKVSISEGRFSTVNLSVGQRKRLALLQCFLEDSPVLLLDEWAADQDPEYRRFFYRTLLPEMKTKGKIVIVITHDDHYFSVADKIFKMDNGKLSPYTADILQVLACDDAIHKG